MNKQPLTEQIAQTITEYVLYWSVIFFAVVLIAMIFNKNRRHPRPRLDKAFIAEKAALFLIVVWSTLVINGAVHTSWYVRSIIWSFLGISETFVLWFIYLERFGRGSFTRMIKAAVYHVYKGFKYLRQWVYDTSHR